MPAHTGWRPVISVIAAPSPNRAAAESAAESAIADPCAGDDERDQRDRGPDGKQEERGRCRGPGRAAEIAGIDAELLPCHRVERDGTVAAQYPVRQAPCIGGVHSLGLVDEPQLLLFLLGEGRKLLGFDRDLVRVQLAGALDAQPLAESH